MSEAFWAVVYKTNSHQKRAQRWYHIGRVVKIDGKWWELYWGEYQAGGRGTNEKHVRAGAEQYGLKILPGTFCDAPAPRKGGEVVWSHEDKSAGRTVQKFTPQLFVETVARMKFATIDSSDDQLEDCVATVNTLIAEARRIEGAEA